jgi:hypothetical protein
MWYMIPTEQAIIPQWRYEQIIPCAPVYRDCTFQTPWCEAWLSENLRVPKPTHCCLLDNNKRCPLIICKPTHLRRKWDYGEHTELQSCHVSFTFNLIFSENFTPVTNFIKRQFRFNIRQGIAEWSQSVWISGKSSMDCQYSGYRFPFKSHQGCTSRNIILFLIKYEEIKDRFVTHLKQDRYTFIRLGAWGDKLRFCYPEFQGKNIRNLAKEGSVRNIMGFGALKEVSSKILLRCNSVQLGKSHTFR